MTEQMKICVQNLGKYNEGELVFEWMNVPATDEEIKKTLNKIGMNERYEEYMIADSEYIKTDEYESITSISERAKEILRLREKFDFSLELMEEIRQEYSYLDKDDFEEKLYEAIVISTEEFLSNETTVGYYYFDEFGLESNLSGNLANYFNYEAYGRDILMESTYYSDSDHIIIMGN